MPFGFMGLVVASELARRQLEETNKMVENFSTEHDVDLITLAYAPSNLEYADVLELLKELASRLSEARETAWQYHTLMD